MRFLGIDTGTSSISGLVYDTDSGGVETITEINNADLPAAARFESIQDTAAIMAIVEGMIERFRAKYSDIRGIGFSGQMHGVLYVDARGEAVSPLYTWQDGRGSEPFRDGLTCAEWLSRETGLPLSTGFGLVTHFYNMENGLVPRSAVKLCTVMDYAVMKLTGNTEPTVDPSNAAALGFFDKERLEFDRHALKRVSIDPAILPRVAAAASRAGYYDGMAVYTATGDNQAAFLGSVRDIERSVHVTVGTSGQLSLYSEKYVEIPGLDTRPLPGGGYIIVGAALCGGQSFALLKDFFMDTVRLFSGWEMSDADLYKAMLSIPCTGVSDDDPVTSTLFEGTRGEPARRGSISNLSISNLTPEKLILSFLRGIARELWDFYDRIPSEIRRDRTLLVGSGNGIMKNALLRRAFEERFGLGMRVSECREAAALGACLCAMVGEGVIKNFADIATL